MTFEKLEKNLMDVVLEEQAKLGFRREKNPPVLSVIYTESLAGYTGYGGTDGSYTGRTAGEHDNKAWKTGCEP